MNKSTNPFDHVNMNHCMNHKDEAEDSSLQPNSGLDGVQLVK
jgi:hypothetical protein